MKNLNEYLNERIDNRFFVWFQVWIFEFICEYSFKTFSESKKTVHLSKKYNRIISVGSDHNNFLVLLPEHFSTDQKLKHFIMEVAQMPFEN